VALVKKETFLHRVHVAGHKRRLRRRRAPERHVHHLDAAHHPEQLAGEVREVSGPARGHVELAGVGLGSKRQRTLIAP
jgi:hypothetical protein